MPDGPTQRSSPQGASATRTRGAMALAFSHSRKAPTSLPLRVVEAQSGAEPQNVEFYGEEVEDGEESILFGDAMGPWKKALLLVGMLGIAALLSSAALALQATLRSRVALEPRAAEVLPATFAAAESDMEFMTVPKTTPQFLTLLASRDESAVERFHTPKSDVVLMDYSVDGSTQCSWCVHVVHSRGVKWELLVRHAPAFGVPVRIAAPTASRAPRFSLPLPS